MFQNLSFLGVTVTTFLLKPKFSDSVPSRNQGRLQPPERLCPNIFASLWHVGYVHCQVHLALPCCSHARCPFFCPWTMLSPQDFGLLLSGQSHLVAPKLKSQGSKLATFLSVFTVLGSIWCSPRMTKASSFLSNKTHERRLEPP